MPNLVGTGLNQVPTNSMLGGMAYQDPEHASIKNLDLKNLSQINSEIADTAVDIFVYDTRKDSDGGDWRKRTQHTSWYNETLGTATRGTRREFPSVAVIVATASNVTIYDGDDPDLPMWMVFTKGTGAEVHWLAADNSASVASGTISALNGTITSGVPGGSGRLTWANFISDEGYNMVHVGKFKFHGGVANRNDNLGWNQITSTIAIVNRQVNDIAMTVLPNAPIDDATGLPIPTIAVATDGGTSVIKDDGSVVDLTGFAPVSTIHIDSNSVIGSVDTSGNDYLYKTSIPTADVVYNTDITAGSTNYYMSSTSSSPTIPILRDRNVSATAYNSKDDTLYRGGNNGLDVIKTGQAVSNTVSNPLITYLTSDYNTGYMYGDIKGAFLSDTDATNKTNGQTDPDRSVNSLALTVTGTITKSAVATGAELVAYSGFSNSTNYMDNTSFSVNFGNPPTISIMFWQKINDLSDYSYAMSLSAGTNIKGGISNGSSSSGYGGQAYFNMGSVTLYTGSRVDDGNWHCLVGTIEGTAKKFYLDGKLISSATISNHDMSGITRIHVGSYGITHAYAHRGSLALLRVSKTVPTAEQIKKIYEDEKHLFQENAKATLYGSSDVVTALAYDEVTEQLHVGTSAGRSDFQGLRRINNTTTAVTTAISAHDEFIVEQ